MRSIGKIAARLSILLAVAGSVALPSQPGFASPQSVFNKLERILTGRGAKARPQTRAARPGKKGRGQAAPAARKQSAAQDRKPDGQRQAVSPAKAPPPKQLSAAGASALPAAVALPAFRPGERQEPAKEESLPAAFPPLPTPAPRPQLQAALPAPEQPAVPGSAPEGPPGPPPGGEAACRTRLLALGVEFTERPPEADPAAGCSLPHPILVTRLSKSVALEPAGLMNCAMAEAAAKFLRGTAQPAALREMGSAITSIGQASAYVCRTRHGHSKMSEHAFGNALDISRFTFAGGATAEVNAAPGEKQARFLGAVRGAACGPFKTVLGPGSDTDHATHFHLDLEQRRHGGTFCQ